MKETVRFISYVGDVPKLSHEAVAKGSVAPCLQATICCLSSTMMRPTPPRKTMSFEVLHGWGWMTSVSALMLTSAGDN